jgi:hypothetical protein
MTNIFISWSGELSKAIAEELRTWMPSVLQFAKPYFTPNDVEKGAKWSSEISKKLSDTHIGVLCLTRENIEKPWILFEAGALSKDLDNSKVCSILFGIDNTDLSGPLTTFQTTHFEKADFKKLMSTINDAGGENKLARDTFEKVFEMWWPQIDASVKRIIETRAGKAEEGEIRSDREILQEILTLSRISAKRSRPEAGEIGPGVVSHLAELSNRILTEARNYKDHDLLNIPSELFEAVTYLNRRLPVQSAKASAVLEVVSAGIEEVRQVIEASSGSTEIDDEIPF